MPKITKKKEIKQVVEIPEVIEVKLEEKKIDRLGIGFPNEDLNKLVEKINELIDKSNGCTI